MRKNNKQDELNQDLGFGSRVAEESRTRLLNRDGSFNVRRKGYSFLRSLNLYHTLLTVSWPKFHLIILSFYLAINLFFAAGYMLCGPDALHGGNATTFGEQILQDFFFSVQTSATIGYGRISPNGLAANILVAVEAFVGLLGFALATGLLFARFSRPGAKIVYSDNAVIAPYREITAFMFRIANEQSNELMEVSAQVTLSRLETHAGKRTRKFHTLALERERVMFMALHWVVVHPIDENSPLHGITEEQLRESDAEFYVLLTGVDETFSTVVHSRMSYKFHEIVWGAKFGDMFAAPVNGMVTVDLRKIHDLVKTDGANS